MKAKRLDKTAAADKSTTAPIIERIKYLVKLSHLTQGKFAQRIGMDPANFSKVMSGILKVSDSFMNRLVVELGISKTWLITGEGTPFEKQADKTPDVIMAYALSEEPIKQGTPVYDIDVTAGYTELSQMFTSENIIGYMDFPKLDSHNVMVKVSGDSMKPVIDDGALIAIRQVNDGGIICWGQIYVVVLEDYRVVKYIRKNSNPNKLTLHSANPDYDDMEINRSDVKGLYMVDAIINCKVL